MITPANLQPKLKNVFTEPQAAVLSEVIHESYSNLVQTSDFNELKELVRQVVVAQVETGQQIKELTAAQNRTEERLEELAVAQKEMVVAQQEMVVAQQETQHSLQALSRQVGGLSDRFGAGVEEAALGIVYFVLTTDLGWKVDVLDSGWHQWEDVEEEVDLYGQIFDPERPNTKVWLIGEAKFNLTTRDVERFAAKIDRIRPYAEGVIFPVVFSYRLRPEVLSAIKNAGLHYIGSNGRMN